jgi:hypothetical protein
VEPIVKVQKSNLYWRSTAATREGTNSQETSQRAIATSGKINIKTSKMLLLWANYRTNTQSPCIDTSAQICSEYTEGEMRFSCRWICCVLSFGMWHRVVWCSILLWLWHIWILSGILPSTMFRRMDFVPHLQVKLSWAQSIELVWLQGLTVQWTQLNRFYLKTETESSLRNVMF